MGAQFRREEGVARRRRSRVDPIATVGMFLAAAVGAMVGSALMATRVPVSGHEPAPPRRAAARQSVSHQEAAPAVASASPVSTAVQFDASYDFDVLIDYPRGTVAVVENLVASNLASQPARELNLFVLANANADGFREFSLESVEVAGKPAAITWTQGGVNMAVTLPAPIGHGERADVRIRYGLRPGADVSSVQSASVSRAGGVLQLLLWYPILSDGHGLRRNGDPLGAQPAATVTYHIASQTAIAMAVPGDVTARTPLEVSGRLEHARDFAFAVSPTFRAWTGTSGETSVAVYADAKAAGGVARDVAVDRLTRFGSLLGTPYPDAHLVVVGGTMDMESSGIVFVRRDYLDDGYTVAHEVAHQWFGWLVGNDQVREPWLDEAFATYLAGGLEPRHEDGFCSAQPVDSPVDRFPDVPLEASWLACDGYVQTVYYKGSWMLDSIRASMGDAAFRAALREYVAAYGFRVATTEDLVRILCEHSAALTQDLLTRWLRLDAGEPAHRRAGGALP